MADRDAGSVQSQRPDPSGRFGGKYVPETLMHALTELESAFRSLASDEDFQKELAGTLRDYVGRESPLYFAERLTRHYARGGGGGDGGGPEVYLKREDLNHTGAHKINNAVAQALLGWGREGSLLRRVLGSTGLPPPLCAPGLGWSAWCIWGLGIWRDRHLMCSGCDFWVLRSEQFILGLLH
ncbi:Tryptophan synthase beta chain 2 [Spatholobus suberectus]|nr:Tryptophan synthase beta chain 2 [Spatholobus suberectus]